MPGQKVLVTGAAGFIGSRLLSVLGQRGHFPTAASFDLLDPVAMESTLRSAPWDTIIHLAAISHVPTCEKEPALAFKTNVGGTAMLLEGLRRHVPSAQLAFASTAQVYAAPKGSEIQQGVVFDENREIAPQNLYARTKWESELMIADAAHRDHLKATVLRLFNHTHKSQSPDFFLPHLYHSIRQVPQGTHGEVAVGNLDVSRDLGSIDDLMEAFAALLDRVQPSSHALEVFNVCSGAPKRLSRLAQELATQLHADVRFVTEPSRVRPGEPELIVGSHQRLSQTTGWLPQCKDESSLIKFFLAD